MNFGDVLRVALQEELENAIGRQNEKVQRRILRDNSNPFHMREIDFQKVFRLSRDGVHHLVEVLGPHLVSGERSNALSVELKIFSALAFFASGCYQKSIAQHFNLAVEQSRLSRIIAEVTDSMVTNLLGHYIKFPESPAELQAVKAGFYEKYNFPGVIGAIDCSHVAIIAPKTNDPHRPGIAYYNRKGFYSLNVQVICDAHMKILNCNARFPGSTHDSAIWGLSVVKRHLEEKYFANELYSSWLIGDSGYPLQPWLITPIENADPDSPEGRYTARHILARNVIERCFGVLKQRFRCLLKHRVLHYSPQRAAKIVLSCAILHNIAIQQNLLPLEVANEDNEIDIVQDNQVNPNYLHEGRRIQREIINTYFNDQH